MKVFTEMPDHREDYPPGYMAYRAAKYEVEQNLASIDKFCQELLNDRQKAKQVLREIGVLQENGKTTWPYRHLRFPELEE